MGYRVQSFAQEHRTCWLIGGLWFAISEIDRCIPSGR